MPGGAFNVAELVKTLGLKPVGPDEMRLRQDIQPVLTVGDLSATTPPHEQPAALFGSLVTGAVGTVGMFEIQSLAPGGGYVGWFNQTTAFSTCQVRVATAPSGVATVVAPAGQLSRAPVLSILRIGDLVATGLPEILFSTDAQQINFGWRDIYVPHGSFFQVELTALNALSAIGVHWREVLAAENVPA